MEISRGHGYLGTLNYHEFSLCLCAGVGGGAEVYTSRLMVPRNRVFLFRQETKFRFAKTILNLVSSKL
jgi:hypothetical protein